jgi:hypothetical protein
MCASVQCGRRRTRIIDRQYGIAAFHTSFLETSMNHFRSAVCGSLLLGLLGLGACGSAPTGSTSSSTMTTGRLAGNNEVPSTRSNGSGDVSATLDRQTNVLTWRVSYAGLTGPVTAGHFHGPAAWGQNAGVVLPFTGNLASPISGSTTLSPAQASDFLAGRWYVNLHTAAYPGGEIRTQLAF